MTEITVVIQGMIMLAASTVYSPSNDPSLTGAAIAIEASKPFQDANGNVIMTGSYGVMVPPHLARVRIKKENVVGPIPQHVKLDLSQHFYDVVNLKGYRVQFGKYSGITCTPLPGGGASGSILAPLSPDLNGVPDLSQIVKDTTISDDARPNSAGFGNINPEKVAIWLDMTTGTLSTDPPSSLVPAEFRPSVPPSLYKYRSGPNVYWKFASDTPCMLITPFDVSSSPETVQLTGDSMSIDYQDVPTPAAMSSMLKEMRLRRGVSYDFELMYRILKNPPPVPPLPYLTHPDPKLITAEQMRELVADVIDPLPEDVKTNINCGPGGNPHP